MDLRRALATLGAVAGLSCATPRAVQVPDVTLVGNAGAVLLRDAIARAPLTVLVFFGARCPCQTRHDPRLLGLFSRYQPRGVQFLMIDSEVEASAARAVVEARNRHYPFPILIDRGARLADQIGAEYATHSVVVDSSGRVRYAGGIDSDRNYLREDADRYLERALDDLLSGHEPRIVAGTPLGCSLEKH